MDFYTGYKPDSAIYYGKEALQHAGTKEEKAKILSYTGLAHNYTGDFKKALECQLEAKKIFGDSDDRQTLAIIYHNTGIAYDYLGEYDKSLEHHFKSLSIRKSENNLSGCQTSLSNIGLVYYFKGDFNNAIKFLFSSMEVASYLGNELGLAGVKTNIGLVYQAQGEYQKELQIQLEAQEIYEKMGHPQDLAMGYNNIGSAMMDLQKWNEAIAWHKKSLEKKKIIGDNVGITMSMQNLGLCYMKTDSLEQAEKISLDGFAMAAQQDDPANKIELANTLASIYIRKKDVANAEKFLNEGIKVSREYTYVRIEKLYMTASQVYELKGDYKSALKFLERHHEIVDSISNKKDHELMVRKEMEAEFRDQQHKIELEQIQKEEQEKLKRETEKQRQRFINILFISGICSLLIVVFVVLKNYREKKRANTALTERNTVISRQNAEISAQKHVIEEKNKDITDSIQYAKRLQDAILPPSEKMNAAFSDYFILYKPKDIVSGDFYWFEQINKKILFAVVDCTGHGVPGGFVSIVAHNALNRAVKEFKLTDPALILDKISELVEESFRQNENKEIRDGMDISLCVLDTEKNLLQWAGANNPLWIVRKGRETSNKTSKSESTSSLVAHDFCLKEIKPDKQPIGLFEDRKPFSQHAMELKPGDALYLFSDGYADQFGGPAGKKFKYAQLKEIILASVNFPMDEQKKILDNAFEHWRKWKNNSENITDLEQIDDVCVIGIRI